MKKSIPLPFIFPASFVPRVTLALEVTVTSQVTVTSRADLSILHITPALLGLFSMVTLLANLHARIQKLPVQQAAWYNKQLPTFSDALRIVKQTLFSQLHFQTAQFYTEIRKVPRLRSTYRFSRSFLPYHMDKVSLRTRRAWIFFLANPQ